MQVETYEIEEVTGEGPNMIADIEALELCEKLGLKGQSSLSKPETKTRFPYPKMSAVQIRTFSVLFPEKTDVEEYSMGIIPLRVLQVLAYCKENGLFASYQVWHPDEIKKDPILTAQTHGERWTENYHLLARWGDALEPFEKLQLKAVPLLAAKLKREFITIRARVDQMMGCCESLAEDAVYNGKAVDPRFFE